LTGLDDSKAIPRVDKRAREDDYFCSYYCGAGLALRRKVILEVGMFWEKLVYGEELDFSYRLLEHGDCLIRTASLEILHREVKQARPDGQWVYNNACYRCWIAAKNLPWRYVVSTSLLWWVYTALISLQRKQFSCFIRGIRDSLLGLPAVLQKRHPVSRRTLQTLKQLSGRRWY
jgi:GT2 family glycosyltransferase